MAMTVNSKLPSPEELKSEYPLTPEMRELKDSRDREIAQVFTGDLDKFVVIVGPCSADREDAVLEYVDRLGRLNEKVSERLILIPRIYTNKPRTTGEGYKGMLHQPDPTAESDLYKGLKAIRRMHLKAMEVSGLTGADEMLYPENRSYLDDILSYEAVGARSVENQQHRLVASGADIPIGMKNPISGDLSVMINSIIAAQGPKRFLYRQRDVTTTGNPLTHAIMRGAANRYGTTIPNYHYEDIKLLCELYAKSGLKNPAVVIDTNHSNSGKQWDEQPRIAKEILHSTRHSDDILHLVKGLMIESYIEDGNQKPDCGVYGKSITDACLGWDKTERLIYELADLR